MTEQDNEQGYVDYFEVLGVDKNAKPGEVRKVYKRKMKSLVNEIARVEITPERRDTFLLDMAKLNAACFILRNNKQREDYVQAREQAIELEQEWRDAYDSGSGNEDASRRQFDAALQDFLSKYVEEAMLDAGRDKECVEASHWNAAHECHAFNILRHFRHSLYRTILERLPYSEVTEPKVNWEERSRLVSDILG